MSECRCDRSVPAPQGSSYRCENCGGGLSIKRVGLHPTAFRLLNRIERELGVVSERLDGLDVIVDEIMDRGAPSPVAAGPGLYTAAEASARLNVKTRWVYDHADDLGAVRLGDGPKAHVRFPIHRIEELISGGSVKPAPPPARPGPPRNKPADLIPIKGEAA